MSKAIKDHIFSMRLPGELAEKLRIYAASQGESVSEIMRRVILELVVEPVGYRCDHVGMMSNPGVIQAVASPCGCVMKKVFDVEDFQKLKVLNLSG